MSAKKRREKKRNAVRRRYRRMGIRFYVDAMVSVNGIHISVLGVRLSKAQEERMGYDIIMMVEARRDGAWHVVAEPPMDPARRDYPSWVALGLESAADWGDPDYLPPIATSRGFPEDGAEKTRAAWGFDVFEHGAQGTSWFTLAELLSHRARLGGIVGDVVDMMGEHGPPDDVRLVFWFVP